LPLLLQMTQDCPDRGLYFYSALAAFKTRTAYANMGEQRHAVDPRLGLRPHTPTPHDVISGTLTQHRMHSSSIQACAWQQLQGKQKSTSSCGLCQPVDPHTPLILWLPVCTAVVAGLVFLCLAVSVLAALLGLCRCLTAVSCCVTLCHIS
jgi:hypothetical protein